MQTSPVADDVDDMKARRIHTVLEQIRSRDMRDVGDDRCSVLDELHSFANTVNGLDLPATASPRPDRHQLSYSDRLMQTRGDLKLLEQLVNQTFHWQPQQSAVSDVPADQPPQVHPVYTGFLFSYTITCITFTAIMDDDQSQSGMAKFDPRHPIHPLTDHHENLLNACVIL